MQRAITVRLPEDVYEQLRREAFERHVSQASIITDALRAAFKGGVKLDMSTVPAAYRDPRFIQYLQTVVQESVLRYNTNNRPSDDE